MIGRKNKQKVSVYLNLTVMISFPICTIFSIAITILTSLKIKQRNLCNKLFGSFTVILSIHKFCDRISKSQILPITAPFCTFTTNFLCNAEYFIFSPTIVYAPMHKYHRFFFKHCKAFFSIRDTCACEISISFAISVCVFDK